MSNRVAVIVENESGDLEEIQTLTPTSTPRTSVDSPTLRELLEPSPAETLSPSSTVHHFGHNVSQIRSQNPTLNNILNSSIPTSANMNYPSGSGRAFSSNSSNQNRSPFPSTNVNPSVINYNSNNQNTNNANNVPTSTNVVLVPPVINNPAQNTSTNYLQNSFQNSSSTNVVLPVTNYNSNNNTNQNQNYLTNPHRLASQTNNRPGRVNVNIAHVVGYPNPTINNNNSNSSTIQDTTGTGQWQNTQNPIPYSHSGQTYVNNPANPNLLVNVTSASPTMNKVPMNHNNINQNQMTMLTTNEITDESADTLARLAAINQEIRRLTAKENEILASIQANYNLSIASCPNVGENNNQYAIVNNIDQINQNQNQTQQYQQQVNNRGNQQYQQQVPIVNNNQQIQNQAQNPQYQQQLPIEFCTCPECPMTFRNIQSLQKHQEYHRTGRFIEASTIFSPQQLQNLNLNLNPSVAGPLSNPSLQRNATVLVPSTLIATSANTNQNTISSAHAVFSTYSPAPVSSPATTVSLTPSPVSMSTPTRDSALNLDSSNSNLTLRRINQNNHNQTAQIQGAIVMNISTNPSQNQTQIDDDDDDIEIIASVPAPPRPHLVPQPFKTRTLASKPQEQVQVQLPAQPIPRALFYCAKCSRLFNTNADLQFHLQTSREHIDEWSNIPIPRSSEAIAGSIQARSASTESQPESRPTKARKVTYIPSGQKFQKKRRRRNRKIGETNTSESSPNTISNFMCPEPNCNRDCYNQGILTRHLDLHRRKRIAESSMPLLSSVTSTSNSPVALSVSTPSPKSVTPSPPSPITSTSVSALKNHLQKTIHSGPIPLGNASGTSSSTASAVKNYVQKLISSRPTTPVASTSGTQIRNITLPNNNVLIGSINNNETTLTLPSSSRAQEKRSYTRFRVQKEFTCSFCGVAFGSNSDLQIHENVHRSDRQKDIERRKEFKKKLVENFFSKLSQKAPDCDKSKNDNNENKTASSTSGLGLASGSVPVWRCEPCNRDFSIERNLKIHDNTVHKPLVCAYCRQRFQLRYSLEMHVMSVHGHLIQEPSPKQNECQPKQTNLEKMREEELMDELDSRFETENQEDENSNEIDIGQVFERNSSSPSDQNSESEHQENLNSNEIDIGQVFERTTPPSDQTSETEVEVIELESSDEEGEVDVKYDASGGIGGGGENSQEQEFQEQEIDLDIKPEPLIAYSDLKYENDNFEDEADVTGDYVQTDVELVQELQYESILGFDDDDIT